MGILVCRQLLLLEDNPGDARLIREYLPPASFSVHHVSTLKEALKCLEQPNFSIVLADLNLPDSQGFSTLEHLHRQAPEMPIVVLTGINDQSLALEALKKGAQDYLPKQELTETLLFRTLNYAIERTHSTRVLEEYFNEAQSARFQLESVILAMPDGLLVVDNDLMVVKINQAAADMLNQWNDCTGQKLTDLDLPQVLIDQIRSFMAHGLVNTHQFTLFLDDPLKTTANVRLSHFNHQGAIVLLQDISEEQHFEQTKRQFISATGHELRTPLTCILGFTDLMTDPEITEAERLSYLDILVLSAERLAKITDRLLNISLVQSGWQIPLNPVTFDIHGVLRVECEKFHKRHPDRHICLDLHPDQVTIRADRDLLVAEICHLVDNAHKFSAAGATVTVAAKVTAKGYEISVTDQGVGISPETIGKVFQPFFRMDGSDTAKGGLGLGLAQARLVVEAHQGTIELVSTLHQGTTVTVRLPATLLS